MTVVVILAPFSAKRGAGAIFYFRYSNIFQTDHVEFDHRRIQGDTWLDIVGLQAG